LYKLLHRGEREVEIASFSFGAGHLLTGQACCDREEGRIANGNGLFLYVTPLPVTIKSWRDIMSEILDLPLLEEIQDIATCGDFYSFTKDEFNKTWADYEQGKEVEAESTSTDLWSVEKEGSPAVETSGHGSPYRDEWDPMLCKIAVGDLDVANTENHIARQFNVFTLEEEADRQLESIEDSLRLKPSDKDTETIVQDVFFWSSDNVVSPLNLKQRKIVTPKSLRRKLLNKGRIVPRRRKKCQPIKGLQKIKFPIRKLTVGRREEEISEDRLSKKKVDDAVLGVNKNIRI